MNPDIMREAGFQDEFYGEGGVMSDCRDCPCNYLEDEGLAIGDCLMEGGKTFTEVEHDCPYAPILKLLAEAKEVDALEIEDDESHKGLEQVTFWIRR